MHVYKDLLRCKSVSYFCSDQLLVIYFGDSWNIKQIGSTITSMFDYVSSPEIEKSSPDQQLRFTLSSLFYFCRTCLKCFFLLGKTPSRDHGIT